jgi:uncharacterized membrane protein
LNQTSEHGNLNPEPNNKISLFAITALAYGLFAVGYLTAGVFGFATIAAIILIYIKRSDVAGTFYAIHFDWLMQTFFWSLLWLAISFIATYILIGWLGIIATIAWVAYRLLIGSIALYERRPPR